jgi:hypothetical protein
MEISTMSKVVKGELFNFFLHFCKQMGKKAALDSGEIAKVKEWRNDKDSLPCELVPHGTPGAWHLDYAGCYGGWVIQEFCEGGGGISCPLGYGRYNASSLLDLINFARESIRLKGGV